MAAKWLQKLRNSLRLRVVSYSVLHWYAGEEGVVGEALPCIVLCFKTYGDGFRFNPDVEDASHDNELSMSTPDKVGDTLGMATLYSLESWGPWLPRALCRHAGLQERHYLRIRQHPEYIEWIEKNREICKEVIRLQKSILRKSAHECLPEIMNNAIHFCVADEEDPGLVVEDIYRVYKRFGVGRRKIESLFLVYQIMES